MISLEDNAAIETVLMDYIRSMDFGDIEGTVASFTSDGAIKDVTGKLWDRAAGGVRAFAARWLPQPFLRGGQHWVQIIERKRVSGDEYVFRSYWSWMDWDEPKGKTPTINMLGLYTDTCVRVDGKWRIKHKVIEAWKTPPADAN